MTTKMMIYPWEKNERVVVYEDHYYFSNSLYSEGRRKAKILRNAPLPKWVRETLEKGNAVEVENLEICKGDRGIYVVIRGKAVKSHTEERETPAVWNFSDDVYSSAKMSGVEIREWTVYDNGIERMESYRGKREEKLLWGITREQRAEFEKTKPEEKEDYWEEFVEAVREARFQDDEFLLVKEVKIYQPHTSGYWFSAEINSETGEMSWKKNIRPDGWAQKRVESEPVRTRIISMEEVNRKRVTYESKYESEDGMRMCSDWDTFEYISYDVLAEDGNTYRVTKTIRIE